MLKRWLFSEFYLDDGKLKPVAAAYGNRFFCPRHPAGAGGSALVLVWMASHQIEAAGFDPRVTVCPLEYDPAALPDLITSAYASMGATSGMSMGALLSKLAQTEPLFGR